MVKIQGASDYDKLDMLVHDIAAKHEFKLTVTGWTRKTYDVYQPLDKRERRIDLLAQIESFATTSGEITVFSDAAMPFAEELGAALEKEFALEEAVIVRKRQPS